MRALKCSILLFIIFIIIPASAHGQKTGTHQSVGLVLSGGGAKGIAHIGAIQALEDNDIPIDYITGTSMGAIVGGLYACGYTPAEMMQLIESNYFSYMSTGRIDPAFTYYFSCEQPSSQMFSLPVGNRDSVETNRFNPQSLVSPLPMVFGFMEIFSAYTAQCHEDFNHLFVPFRCVSSDMTKRRKAVFSRGNLAESIRASMSFPLIFQAVQMNDNVYYDGGIYDNFPVDVMRSDFGPDIMIGFDVSTPTEGPQNSYMDQLEMLVMNPQTYDLPEADGVKIHINLSDFSLLDFGAARAIYQRGYDRTMAMIDSIKDRVHSRMPARVRDVKRGMFKSATPELCFSDVTVSGGTRRQNEYLQYLFKPASGSDTIGIDRARLAFYRAIGSEKLSRFMPSATMASDSSGLFNLHFDASVKSKFDIGGGAFITSSNNSYLYCRAGYSSMSFSTINTNLEAWIGQSYMAGALNAAVYLHSSVPSAFKLLAVASRRRYYESEKLFFRDNEPSFVVSHDYFGRIGWATAAGHTGAIEVGVGGGQVYNSFFRNNNAESYTAGRDHIALNLGQLYATYTASTLNNTNYPTSGYSRSGRLMALLGRSHYKAAVPLDGETDMSGDRRWIQLDWKEKDYFDISRAFSLGIEGQAVLSTRKLFNSYYGSISTAPAFVPTQAAGNVFDPELRANSFLAAGFVPVYKYNSSLSARMSLNAFVPLRAIGDTPSGLARYGNWFGSAHFFGELDIVYSLPIADICAYCNYSTTRSKFSAGISFGFYLPAPSFL